MSAFALSTVAFLALPAAADARPKTDIVTMKNGDRYTCEIVGLAQGQLKIKTVNTTGAVLVNWINVDRIETTQFFAVELADGRTFAGVISKVPRGPEMENDFSVAVQGTTLSAPAFEVVTIKRSGTKLKGKLSGGISAGFSYAKGNNQTSYSLDANVSARARTHEVSAALSSSFSGTPGGPGTDRDDLIIQYLKSLAKHRNWMIGSYNDFLRSEEQKLNLRATFGAIAGRWLVRTNRTALTLLSGAVYTSEHYRYSGEENPNRSNAEGLAGLTFSIFRFDSTNITANTKVFPSISDAGRIRIDTNVNGKIDLTHSVYWNISLYSNYDSRPPANAAKSDFGVSFGLGWTF